MNRHFVLDFDGTLIDTDVYWAWIVEQFSGIGLETDRVKMIGEALFPLRYTMAQHAINLGLESDVVQDLAQRAYKFVQQHHANLLFPDVTPFLQRFKQLEKSILTFGDEEHQFSRVLAAGLQPHVGRIHVATPEVPKPVLLASLLETSRDPLVFIDDDVEQLMSVHETKLPIELIRMRRPGQRKSVVDHELDGHAWRVLQSFEDYQ